MSNTLIAKNQFGEQSNFQILGGSSQLQCSFVADVANANGLGLNSLKGNGIASVFMHTSATPLAGNPNPAIGYAVIQFAKGYAGYISNISSFISQLSGSSLAVNATALTPKAVYVITAVGTSTAADWLALGVPANITPAIGVAFVALVSGSGSGNGTVQAPAATGSTIASVEICGDPNAAITPAAGGQIIVQFLAATSSGVTTQKPTAVPDKATVVLSFNLTASPGPQI